MLEWIFNQYNYPFWVLVISIIAIIIGLVSRSFLTYIKFVYPNAKFEAIGNPFIEEKELSRLVESKSLSTFKDSLNTFRDYDVDGKDTSELQRSLDDHFIQTIEMMRKDSSKKLNDFYDLYIKKLDFYLIKNELKTKIEGKKTEQSTVVDQAILSGTKELLKKIIGAERGDLREILENYGFEKEVIVAVSEENIDFLSIDSAIDKHVINSFKQVKVPYKCEQAKQRFVNSMIDICNIKNVLRAKQFGYDASTCMKLFLGEGREIAYWKFKEMAEVEQVSQVISSLEGTSYYDVLKDAIERYTQEKSVQALEDALDSLFLKLVKNISIQNYITIGPTIRFLVSKEFEIRNLKIIAKGIGENLSSDIIKSFLVKEAG